MQNQDRSILVWYKWKQLLTNTHMSSLTACQCVFAAASPGVDRNRFANNKTIFHQFTDLLAWRQKAEWATVTHLLWMAPEKEQE